jgi:cytochrome P450
VPPVPLAFDPPVQTRYRRILQPFFSLQHPAARGPAPSARHRPYRRDPRTSSCGFVAEIAEIFPVQTFLEFFGLPTEDLGSFMTWKEAILGGSDASGAATENDNAAHAMALFSYLGELVQRRRGVAGDDVLSQLSCIDGVDALTDAQAIGLCFLFVLAGLDTVTGSLGLGMERLAKSPRQRRELVDNPGLDPAAVEELVRLDPPAPFTPRVTTTETTIDGRYLPAGSHVSTYLAAANRDESVRPHPFDLDSIDRTTHTPASAWACTGAWAHTWLASRCASFTRSGTAVSPNTRSRQARHRASSGLAARSDSRACT